MWFHVSDDAVLNHWTESHQGQPNRLAFSIISCKFFNQILFYWNYWYYCVFILHSEILFTGRCCFGTRERRSWFSTKAGTIPAICQSLNIIAWSIMKYHEVSPSYGRKRKSSRNTVQFAFNLRPHPALSKILEISWDFSLLNGILCVNEIWGCICPQRLGLASDEFNWTDLKRQKCWLHQICR